MSVPPPAPKHLIRSHASPVSVVAFSDDSERIYSGDASGTVVITSTRTLRAIATWKAHTDGLMGIQEWENTIITHGRDNKLHIWKAAKEPSRVLGGSASLPGLHVPELGYSLDVNALNYCRFSLLPLAEEMCGEGRHALIAVPNLVESSLADVWTLPGKDRLHAAIGKVGQGSAARTSDGRDVLNPIGIIMSMNLTSVPHPHAPGRVRLRVLCGYENGSVTMREYTRDDREVSIEGIGWDVLWTVRLHVESVMGMAMSKDGSFALSVSADHLVGRYIISDAEREPDIACTSHRTKHPGNACISIRDDGRVCAVGGWDGKIRLYSTKTFKSLGTLNYHKKNCQSIAFAPDETPSQSTPEEDDDNPDMSEAEKKERGRWLVSGGQDNRVAIWSLMTFEKM